MFVQKTKLRFGLAGLIGLMAVSSVVAEGEKKPYLVSTDYDGPGSTTRGIQEAIEALPAGGGTVYVPPGDYMMERTIRLRQGVQLIGAGKATRLWKAPMVVAPLAEDVSKGATQDYVVVTDPTPFRPGMAVHPCDIKGYVKPLWQRRPWIISRIEDNRVHIVSSRHWSDAYPVVPFKPSVDLKVERDAVLMTQFTMVMAAPDCLIENLAIDGNLDGQTFDGITWRDNKRKYPDAFIETGIRHVQERCTIRRCWISNNFVNISCSAGRALITDCDISGGWQGIHPGSGPLVKIVNNLIHDNLECGIYMCMGNFGCIIENNHIYSNLIGIGGLSCRVLQGNPTYEALGIAHLARDGDHYHIISQNIIFDNMREGIATEGGRIGPKDYVIMGNIVMNNNKQGVWYTSRHRMPAGIALYNAQNCVVANNRCYDDQDEFGCGELTEDASAGSREIKIKHYKARPVNTEFTADPPVYRQFRLVLEDGVKREEVNVTNRVSLVRLQLDQPLKHDYPRGTIPRILKSQQWGIVATGPESQQNVIMGNQCSENMVGGLLHHNPGGAVVGNIGDVAAVDTNKTFMQNVYPAREIAPLANGGFEEEGGWELSGPAEYDAAPHSGRRALKLGGSESSANRAKAVSAAFAMKPTTRYRVTGWVRMARMPENAPVELTLTAGEQAVRTRRARGGHDGANAFAPKGETQDWMCYDAVLTTGEAPVEGTVLCRYFGKTESAWFDDIQVEEVAHFPLRAFGVLSACE